MPTQGKLFMWSYCNYKCHALKSEEMDSSPAWLQSSHSNIARIRENRAPHILRNSKRKKFSSVVWLLSHWQQHQLIHVTFFLNRLHSVHFYYSTLLLLYENTAGRVTRVSNFFFLEISRTSWGTCQRCTGNAWSVGLLHLESREWFPRHPPAHQAANPSAVGPHGRLHGAAQVVTHQNCSSQMGPLKRRGSRCQQLATSHLSTSCSSLP